MHGFSYGIGTVIGAYLMSCIGSALGLLCASRARAGHSGSRARWLILAALSIGGTGIWVMHFIAMLGSSVPGTSIRYDGSRTILSMVVAVVVVALGLFIVGFTELRWWTLLVGGAVTGAGVAIMHYVGMSALNLHGEINYDRALIAVSVLIAVAASTAALWAALKAKGMPAVFGASAIMGVAVSGMHYTGMAAATVIVFPHVGGDSHSPVDQGGLAGSDFLMPMVIGISFLTMVTLAVVALSPNEKEMADEAALQERLARFR